MHMPEHSSEVKALLLPSFDARAFSHAARRSRFCTIQGAKDAGVNVPYELLLSVAIAYGREAFVDFLLEGAWIPSDHVCPDAYEGRTARSWAAEVGALALVE